MNLLEMIEELKDSHDEEVFNKAINRLISLIHSEIGDYLNNEDIYSSNKEEFDNKELQEFIDSEKGFRDLIEWNITDFESFSKVVDLVKELKELQFRRSKIDFFDSKIEKHFTEVTLENFGLVFNPDYSCYYKYAELIPYMKLNPYLIMYDDYVGIDAIYDYMENNDGLSYDYYEFDENIKNNQEQLDELKFFSVGYQVDMVEGLCDFFLAFDYTEDDLRLKHNGLLKHYIENNIIELFGNSGFIKTLQLLKNADLSDDSDKSENRDLIMRQFKSAIIEKLSVLDEEVKNDNTDVKQVLKYVGVLCNEFCLNELLDNDVIVHIINEIFFRIKERRSRCYS